MFLISRNYSEVGERAVFQCSKNNGNSRTMRGLLLNDKEEALKYV